MTAERAQPRKHTWMSPAPLFKGWDLEGGVWTRDYLLGGFYNQVGIRWQSGRDQIEITEWSGGNHVGIRWVDPSVLPTLKNQKRLRILITTCVVGDKSIETTSTPIVPLHCQKSHSIPQGAKKTTELQALPTRVDKRATDSKHSHHHQFSCQAHRYTPHTH